MFFKKQKHIMENTGFCPICDTQVEFYAEKEWFRDFYFCKKCGSIPRERALMEMIKSNYPDWKKAVIHESSPAPRGASARLRNECKNYIRSHYFVDRPPGSVKEGMRCENLEALTFENNSIDLHISQDVLEHVFNPSKAFSEIARTLAPGGMHIFTVPLVNKWKPSRQRAKLTESGEVIHLEEASYHGNPIGDGRSLVTMDWGFDICEFIFKSSGLFTQMVYIDDIGKGIRAEYIEVLITHKPTA